MKNINKLTNKEERFAEILSESQWEVNTSDIWASLEGNLPVKEEKKRRFLPWFICLGFLSVMLGASVIFFTSNNTSAQTNDVNPANTNTKKQQIASSSTSIQALNTNNNTAQTVDQANQSLPSSNQAKGHLENTSLIPNNKIQGNQANSNYTSNNKQENNRSQQLEASTNSSNNSKISSLSSQIIGSEDKAQLAFSTRNENEVLLETEKHITTSNDARSLFDYRLLSIINSKPISFSRDLESQSIVPAHRSKVSPLYFSLGFGSILPSWSHSTSDGDLTMNNEKAMPGFSAQASLGYSISRRFFVEGGLRLSEAVARYNNLYIDETTEDIQGVQSIHINSFGGTSEQIGSIQQTTIDEYELQWHRKHRSLDAFVNVGVEVIRLNQLSLSAIGGLSYNLNTKHSGYYVGNSASGIEQFENQIHPYRDQTGISWTGGLRIGYQINHIEINLNTFYKNNRGSLTNNENPFLIKSSQLGLELGMVYRPY